MAQPWYILCFMNFINVVIYTMATDYDLTDPTEKTPLIPGEDGDDDDDDNDWSNVDLSLHPIPEEEKEQWRFPSDTDPNTTNPFEPGASSTPSGGENIPMTTRLPPEKQGASGGTAETSFNEDPVTLENMATKEAKGLYPKASHALEFWYKSGGHGLVIEVKYRAKKGWYTLLTKSRGDTEKTPNKSLLPGIKQELKPYRPPLSSRETQDAADAEIAATNTALQDLQKQEETQRQALQQAETKANEAQRLRREMDVIRGRTKDVTDRMQELEDTQGPLYKDAIQKLKDEKRKLATEHQAKRKQLDVLAKAGQQAQKLQQDINKTILSKGETERRLGQLKAQKDAIQPLDELKQKAAELNEHITEDLRIIEDQNTSPSEREAVRQRLATRKKELELLNEEIEARERQRPLLQRVREIFRKYGWTMQAVVLAVGLVLGALALAGLNGLKAGTKAVGRGLKAVGQKLGYLLPGLIGSIVSFIFKAAGQVLSFLGEHAWLLILAVVAFFMETLLKKRRTQ